MRKSFWNSIKNGCVIFAIITVISYTVGMLMSSENRAFIPSLKSIYIYLAFSILFSFVCNLLKSERINTALRLIIHFAISAALFFCVIVLGGGFAESGFATIVLMTAFVIVYIIFSVIYLVIAKKKERKANSNKQYSSVFN